MLHGRRNRIARGNFAAVEQLVSLLEKDGFLCRIGLLEGDHQTLEAALTQLQELGVTEYLLVPVLLFGATHFKQDLPERTQKILGEAKVQLLAPLGTTQAIYQSLKQQLMTNLAEKPGTRGLLIAHGTPHYQEPAVQLQQIAAKMSQETGYQILAVNYIGSNDYQSFLTAHPEERFVIQPFFLTHGHLVEKISQWIKKNHLPMDVILPTLEESPALVEALKERLVEAGCIPS